MTYGSGDGAVLDRTDVDTSPNAHDASLIVLPRAISADRRAAAPRRRQSAFPELDCIRDRLPSRLLAAAERRAVEIGIGADRVLIAAGFIDEDNYVYALSRWLGFDYEPFDGRDRACCPLDNQRLLEAANTGLLPLIIDGELVFVVAPRSVRQFVNYVAFHPGMRFRLTSSARLNLFIADKGGGAVAHKATAALQSGCPHLCAGTFNGLFRIALATLLALLLGMLIAFPSTTLVAIEAVLAATFLAALGLRLVGSHLPSSLPRTKRIPDRELPVYTIVAALYQEANAVEDLVASLREIDYPPEKLDIKLVIEADDLDTWAALARLKLGAPFEIIIAPPEGPRTKPKALNAALLFARGTFTVIYDAEDRPEPDQLRRAVLMFLADNDDLACVQAALTIDNTVDSWLTRLFTAEYAAQFDLFLPGLARLHLPLPLGGSSNHFRTAALRHVGAWDPYNVTEDADLGMRLGRFGYRATVINSTTYEEAPARLRPWLRQRTRWFKGWMQTWSVHMRTPRRLFRELGPSGFLTFQLVIGGNVLSALIHPIFLASVIHAVVAGHPILSAENQSGVLTWLFGTSLIAGYLISMVLGMRGLARRGLLAHAWALALVPVHWGILSLAAWRALYQLVRDPQGWEKTEHGLAKNSRRAAMTSAGSLDVAVDPEQQPQLRSAA